MQMFLREISRCSSDCVRSSGGGMLLLLTLLVPLIRRLGSRGCGYAMDGQHRHLLFSQCGWGMSTRQGLL